MQSSKTLKKVQALKAQITEIEESLTEEDIETRSPRSRNYKFENPSPDECKKKVAGKRPDYVIFKGKRYGIENNTELLAFLFDTVWEIDPKKFPLLIDKYWKNFFRTSSTINRNFTKKLKCGLYTRNDTQTHYVLYICIHTWTDVYCLPAEDFEIYYVSK